MNIVEQWFPKKRSKEDIVINNMCLVMQFYGLSKRELDDLDIPEYLIMRDYAIDQLKAQQKELDKMNTKGGRSFGKA